jgi:hypothetical protein
MADTTDAKVELREKQMKLNNILPEITDEIVFGPQQQCGEQQGLLEESPANPEIPEVDAEDLEAGTDEGEDEGCENDSCGA